MSRKSFLIRLLTVLLLVSLGAAPPVAQSTLSDGDIDANRAKILSYIIRQELPRSHFSHKAVDDELSRAAFDLYLNQIDFQKRLLLKTDVDRLRGFVLGIDDEIKSGNLQLPRVARDILVLRTEQARDLVRDIFEEGFDFNRHEFLLTDPEKLEFCRTKDELRDRWRKLLKFQVINRFLNLEDDDTGAADEVGDEKDRKPRTSEELIAEATEKVRKNYEEYFSRVLQETVRDQYDRYFDAAARAYDPHTNYMPPMTKEDFDISLRGSLEGIGATLRQEDGYVKVVKVIPGSAAYRQGDLEAEDSILRVAEGKDEPVDITDMPLRKAVSLIRGKKGTEVRLTVKKPDGSRTVIPIIRDVVEIEETFVKNALLTDPASGRRYGYIKIPSFYRDFSGSTHGDGGRNSTDDVRAALDEFAASKTPVDGIVLDLRSNGGGALTDAIRITGLFIDQGPVVQVRNSDGDIRVRQDRIPGVSYAGPLVVLVNRFSASASEILAGALQDYKRAILIGSSHTHGKGTVQTMVDLSRSTPFPNMDQYRPLGALKVTIQKFYRVSGESTQYRGVVPDIVLPDVMEYMETGERYLDNSLPWDTVSTTSYTPWASDGPSLDVLAARSAERVRDNADFIKITTQANRSKEKRDKALQALNIENIRRERDEASKERTESIDGVHRGHDGESKGKRRDARLSPEEKKKLWVSGLLDDPYVNEAMAVLGDLSPETATANVKKDPTPPVP